jgi:S-adenosylmethionine/arginine decarboxylase-like enzyme
MTLDVRHKHLIVRAEIGKAPGPEDCDSLVAWIKELIDTIEMKIMFGPTAMYCHVEGNRGMTAFAIIETSHVAFHSWDELDTALLEFDVYTCSDLNPEDVIAALDVFEPTKVEWKFLDREHGLTLVSEQAA